VEIRTIKERKIIILKSYVIEVTATKIELYQENVIFKIYFIETNY